MRWLDSTIDSMGMHLSKPQETVLCYGPGGHGESGRAARWKINKRVLERK